MSVFINIILLLWSMRIVANILSYVHLWFVKEYRWDRMLIHLRTKQGKRFLLIPFRRPPISPKTVSLAISLLAAEVIILTLLPISIFLRFLLADLALFPLTFLSVGIFGLPTLIFHQIKIKQAKNDLEEHQPMTVIGVTGSYGKTSTKEYLATILSTKHKVLKTEASKNSAIGIAEVILSRLKDEHEIFIVEMGAYRRGEIKEMTEMVKPQIGIITAINPQHQDLFGSIENTMKSKYELVQGLSGRRIAIFNADSPYVRHLAAWAKQDGVHVWSVGQESGRIPGASRYFTVKGLRGDLKSVSFSLVSEGETVKVATPVLGEHQSTNITLAIAGAVATGLPLRQAVKAAAAVSSFAKTMQPVAGVHDSLFINDTFNNNPDAAKAALDFLAKTKGKKILVFQPMIELGSFAKESHEQVGERAAQICDEIILTNNNFLEYFEKGVKKVAPQKIVKVLNPKAAAAYIRLFVSKGDAVLFKGKEAEQILKLLVK